MSVQSFIAPISSAEFLQLSREALCRAVWQVSDNNSDRLFGMSAMFTRLAGQQSKSLRPPKRARKDSEIRVWRSWDKGGEK